MATWTQCYRCGRSFQPSLFPKYFLRATCDRCLAELETEKSADRAALAEQWKQNGKFWGKLFYYFFYLPMKYLALLCVWFIASTYGNMALGVCLIASAVAELVEKGTTKSTTDMIIMILVGCLSIGIGVFRYLRNSKPKTNT